MNNFEKNNDEIFWRGKLTIEKTPKNAITSNDENSNCISKNNENFSTNKFKVKLNNFNINEYESSIAL